MNNYLEILKIALMFFPFIAFFVSIPFILIQYHKFGSVSLFKSFLIYSFTLYFICAYFLVILPLPSIEEVKLLTTPRMQLIPFNFIGDFIRETSLVITNPRTYIKVLTDRCFYVPMYNLLLTLPFGIYLRYYYKTSLTKTIVFSSILSLFFEITQLTGLYGIYPRGYRLFDIDDLILNTLGGLCGYLIAPLFIKIFPKKEEINKKALRKGRDVSGFRRFTSLCLDVFLYMVFCSLLSLCFKNLLTFTNTSIVTIIIYFIIIPFILGGKTLGDKYVNLKIVDKYKKNNFFKLSIRVILFVLFYLIMPIVFVMGAIFLSKINLDPTYRPFILITYIVFVIVLYMIEVIRYLFTNKPLLYEKISDTKLISTIK